MSGGTLARWLLALALTLVLALVSSGDLGARAPAVGALAADQGRPNAGVPQASGPEASVPQAGVPSAPQPTVPGSALVVRLITIGQGDAVWERFGHNAIWVSDRARGTDVAYNWGMFDFAQPNFLGRFLTGDTRYWMEGFDAYAMIDAYRDQNRTVLVQELNLTPVQRRDLQAFLEWNARPENRFYRYDYYLDNCSTRVRDALDRTVGGAIRKATASLPTGTSFRSHTRRLTAGNAAVYTGIQLALGQPADRPISAWEEAFLPVQLAEHVRRVQVPGPGGLMVPLVRQERVLFRAHRPPELARAPNYTAYYLAAGVVLALALALLAGRAPRAVAVLGSAWALVAGLAGTALLLAGTVTRHVFMGRNENLLQVNPLHLALAAALVAAAFSRRGPSRLAERLAVATAVLSLAGLAVKVLPWFDQRNVELLAFAVPVNLALAWAIQRARLMHHVVA